jgi:hypothetical protein
MRDALYISMACQGLAVLTDYAWYLFWLVWTVNSPARHTVHHASA